MSAACRSASCSAGCCCSWRAAAIWRRRCILPLYYLADATITLARRIARREPIWQAHRTHFYQRATDNGFTVPQIVTRVFLVNLALAVLALISVAALGVVVPLMLLTVAGMIVAWLLVAFAQRPAP